MTDDSVLISFIMPALNEEECIGTSIRAIKSYSQGYKCEIIVVDNGSTDRTAEIVRSEHVTLLQARNTTIAYARNKGVEESNGRILIFLDADVIVTASWGD
ncbi:MAG: glycosyltransferase family 2 protein [Nitrospirae bacterium]|nr:glycosyltransferase family 2 protein [Nitrospirota bacterium]